jgi:flagellar protein FlbD
VIAVTCRNGEHFTLDPDAIERVESGGDTTVILEDGTKFVIGQSIDELILIVRAHRAAAASDRRRRLDGPAPAPGFVPGRPPRRAPRTPGGPAPD